MFTQTYSNHFKHKLKIFLALLNFILSICKGDTNDDYILLRAHLFQVEAKLLDNFRSSIKHVYEIAWHDMINKSEDVALPAKIPRIIHFIWFGNPLPQANLANIATWKKHHPNWQFCFWDETAVAKEFKGNLENQAIFDSALLSKRYAEASDIVRYEILKRFGGLYLDSDTKCYKSFDTLHQKFDFYTGVEPWHDCICGNCLIGSIPAHPILDLIITDIKNNYALLYENLCNNIEFVNAWKKISRMNAINNQKAFKIFTTLVTTGPGCLTRNLATYFTQLKDNVKFLTLIAPKEYFCGGDSALFANHEFHNSWMEKPTRIAFHWQPISCGDTAKKLCAAFKPPHCNLSTAIQAAKLVLKK